MRKFTVLSWHIRDPDGSTEVYGTVETGQKAVVTRVQSLLKSLQPLEILITDGEQDPKRLEMVENVKDYEWRLDE